MKNTPLTLSVTPLVPDNKIWGRLPFSIWLKYIKYQIRRYSVLKRDNMTCSCGEKVADLHNVVSPVNLPGIEPWDYEQEDLIILCDNCLNDEQEGAKSQGSTLCHHLDYLWDKDKASPYILASFKKLNQHG